MSRKYPSQILRGDLTDVNVPYRVIHVDDTGIYVATPKTIAKFSHCEPGRSAYSKPSLIFRYTYQCGYSMRFVCENPIPAYGSIDGRASIASIPKAAFATGSAVFAPKQDQLVHKYHFHPHMIHRFIYHPFRNTYFAASDNNYVFEVHSDLRSMHPVGRKDAALGALFRYTHHEAFHDVSILPSNCSTNTYLAWTTDYNIDLSVIRDCKLTTLSHRPVSERPTLAYLHEEPPPITILLSRPEQQDALTLLCDSAIYAVDLWRGSSACLRKACPITRPRSGAHISPHICVVGGNDQLSVVDYRCGLVHQRSIADGTYSVWFANGRIFIYGWSKLHMLDI